MGLGLLPECVNLLMLLEVFVFTCAVRLVMTGTVRFTERSTLHSGAALRDFKFSLFWLCVSAVPAVLIVILY
jgi:hypothetical protein